MFHCFCSPTSTSNHTKYRLLVVIAALLFGQLTAVADEKRAAAWQNINQQFEVLRIEIQTSRKQGRKLAPQQIAQRRQQILNHVIALYRQQPRDAVALDAMLLALHSSNDRKTHLEVCRNLLTNHLQNPSLYMAFPMIASLIHFDDDCEQLLLQASERGSNEQVRHVAALQLAVIYSKMAQLLANTTELGMSMEEYVTSKTRSSFGELSNQAAANITHPLCSNNWLDRDWRHVRSRALQLVQAVMNSEQPIGFYLPAHKKNPRKSAMETVADVAAVVHHRLTNASSGVKLEEFAFKDFEGNATSLSSHLGNVVVIDVWATWCRPCVTGMASMRDLNQRMAGRPFSLITISVDSDLGLAKRFAERNDMPFHNWYVGENSEFLTRWGIRHIPKIIVLDEKGVVRTIPNIGHQDLVKHVDQLVTAAQQSQP
ncbi:TlpA family protein disulfide reductase [bacterium SCSIO 12696]|nr:TlpA family protein disulfide reductase [bacterium SCSIO 12696]